jgi:hypothetical protein
VVFLSVCSQLRAFATHVVYLSKSDISDGKPVLTTRAPVQALDLASGSWERVSRLETPVRSLRVVSASAASAARSLALKENQIFEEASLKDQAYTLVLYPEEAERQVDGKVRRVVPLVVLRGAFSVREGGVEALQGRVTRAEFRAPRGVRGT